MYQGNEIHKNSGIKQAEKAMLINIVCGRIKKDKDRRKSVLEKVLFKHIQLQNQNGLQSIGNTKSICWNVSIYFKDDSVWKPF